nr:TetR/AcrR family transcriptional regulator [uncultured Blautia sp.]
MPGFTRKIILRTLIELMNEKPLSKITVKDIVERCGINRNTFYYHFRDIPDAVEEVVREELEYIEANHHEPESVRDCMDILVNTLLRNKKAMLHLYSSVQRDVFAGYVDSAATYVVKEYIANAAGEINIPQDDMILIERYYKCVFVGIILDWLRNNMEYDVLEDMKRLEKIYEMSLHMQYKQKEDKKSEESYI